MKRVIVAMFVAAFPLHAFAVGGYVEGSLGYTFVSDVDVKGSATTPATGTISDIDLVFEDAVGYGLEIGIRNFEQHNVLRIGFAWDRFDADLDEIDFSATGGNQLPAGNYSISSGELRTVGLDFDNTVDVYTANLYYDFPSSGKWSFFFGGGIGFGDVENAKDNELAWKVALGARYPLSDNMYLGLRYDHIRVDEVEDELGVEYNNIGANRVSATLLFNF